MAVQFAGSDTTGGRRRRRIVVNGEGPEIDPSLVGGEAADMESQLVASAAAGPWVPVSELRIWIYASLIGILVGASIYLTLQPQAYRTEVRPLTDLLFNQSKPLVMVVTEVLLLGLSALLGHLIGWYRSRGKLDFAGRYRFWPWASMLFGTAAFCLATGAHQAVGQVAANLNLIPWRPTTVGWLFPVTVVALPITLFLDRDVRHRRSCLWTVRTSITLWIAAALLEIYRPELRTQPWFALAQILIPVVASLTLFLGLWLHARVVAYICPDPPELNERSAWSQLLAAGMWTFGAVAFWRWRKATEAGAEADEAAPKRRRKKADTEEVTTKKKRKAPAKKPASRSRPKAKPVEEEAEEEEVEAESTVDAENESVNETVEESSSDTVESVNEEPQEEQQEAEQWEEPAEEEDNRRDSRGKGRYNQVHRSHGSAVPAPHSRRQESTWEEESGYEESHQSDARDSSASSDDDEEQSDDGGSKIDPEQMKGLSKRQKRELRKQLREQERSRGR